MRDDIVLNKAAIIERCLRRIGEEYAACPELNNYTHLDAMILNIERACQAAIDMAMHFVAMRRLGIPQGSADAFALLARGGILDKELSLRLMGMVGFRNVAIHEYQGLDMEIVRYVLEKGLGDFVEFCRQIGVEIRKNRE
ncbi:MAG: DUF86 domain-containing protein [Thermodesulfobacteriota bacterium]